MKVRFAPSPTGALHIGGARTALFNYLLAKRLNGKLVLRIEDTDRERSLDEHEADIKSGLKWLGIDWDEGPDVEGPCAPYYQAQREDKHIAAGKKLLEQGDAYVDDGGATRLRYPKTEVIVKDLICGDCVFNTEALGNEPVLLRSDGTPTFQLANVVDDIYMGITHVVRGQDHLTNSAKHQLIFQALGAEVPQFAHLPLILGEDGSKLSKRNSEGMTTLSEFKEKGYLPEAIDNFLMLLGWSHPEEKETLSMDEAIEVFDLSRVGKTGAIFELNKLNFLNGWWIRQLPAERIAADSLSFTGDYKELIEQKGSEYWLKAIELFRERFESLEDAEALAAMLVLEDFQFDAGAKEEFSADPAKGDLLAVAEAWKELLHETDLDGSSDCLSLEQVNQLFSATKKKSGRKGKELFKPLRVAILGSLSGPDLKSIATFIRKDILELRVNSLLEELS